MSYKIEEDKLSIIFDTNVLEARFGDDIFLSDWKANNEFYEIVTYIKTHNLVDKINLFIPEIAILEVKEHMIRHFKNKTKDVETKIENFNKVFASLIDLNYSFKYDLKEYKELLNSITKNFLENNNCEVLEYPKELGFIDNIVDKAIRSVKPFREANGNKKKYSDAGFKDALIVETIFKHKECNNDCIFMTNDNDYSEVITKDGSELSIYNKSKDIIEYISNKFKLGDEEIFKSKIEKDEYLKDQILDFISIVNDKSLTKFEVNSIKKDENENYEISIICISNETEYLINIIFDPASNEFISIENVTENE